MRLPNGLTLSGFPLTKVQTRLRENIIQKQKAKAITKGLIQYYQRKTVTAHH